MANGSDGHIVLKTKIDLTGIKQGSNDIKNATQKTSKSVEKLATDVSRALSVGDVKGAQLINTFKRATEEVEKQTAKVEELRTKLQGLESGQITTKNSTTSKIQKDFEQANLSIETTKSKIDEIDLKISQITNNALRGPSGELVFTDTQKQELDKLDSDLLQLENKLETSKQKAQELGMALKTATGASTQSEIEKTRVKLAEAENKLQNLTTKAEIAGQKMNEGANNYSKEVSVADKAISKLGKRIGRLAASALVFSAITKAFTELRKTITSMLMSNEQFRASVNMLQASLWTMAQPIYAAVLPGLQTLVGWLTKAVLYIATFFSALGGKSLKQTIASAKALNKQADAFNNVSKAAKDAKKQLASFDELSILQNGVATTGGSFSSTNNGFDDIENLLDSGALQDVQNFGDWVSKNSKNIKTFLEIAGWSTLILTIGNLISKITGHGGLLDVFKKKDKALDTQTKKTQLETSTVKDLSNAWSTAPAFAFALIPAIDGLTNSGAQYVPTFEAATEVSNSLYPALSKVTNEATALSPEIINATEKINMFSPALDVATESAGQLSPAISKVTGEVTKLSPPVVKSVEEIETEVKQLPVVIEKQAEPARQAVGDVVEKAAEGLEEKKPRLQTAYNLMLTTLGTMLKNYLTDSLFPEWKSGFSTFIEKIKGYFKKIDWGAILGTLGVAVLGALAIAEPTPFGEAGMAALLGGFALPGYATGTVVPPNKPHLAWFGDNTQEPEVVSPVSTMKQAFTEAMLEMGGGFGNTEVVLEIDGREFGRAVVEQGNRENRRIGTRLVIA